MRQGIGCLVNPTVVIKVLSPSTAARDEVDKLLAYTAIRTSREYLVVSSERYVVKMFFRRQAEETWGVRLYTQPTDSVGLESCGCQLTLAEIYAGVEFPERDDFPVGWAGGLTLARVTCENGGLTRRSSTFCITRPGRRFLGWFVGGPLVFSRLAGEEVT